MNKHFYRRTVYSQRCLWDIWQENTFFMSSEWLGLHHEKESDWSLLLSCGCKCHLILLEICQLLFTRLSLHQGGFWQTRCAAHLMREKPCNKKSPMYTWHLGKPRNEGLSVKTQSKRYSCQTGNTYSFKYPVISEAFIQRSSRMQKFEKEILGLPRVASFRVE